MQKKIKVFIDGREGTTGLKILERFAGRDDLELIEIPDELRKDPAARAERLNAADIAFLCLPDAAAREAVAMVTNPNTRIIDASTAHRTDPAWTYGFPEMGAEQRGKIAASRRIANPGCHATGFISCVYPLVKAGVIPADFPLTAYSLTGYSGGGKKLIAEYEAEDRDVRHESHRIYGTNLRHKHLPEMKAVCGLTQEPVFSPILGDFYKGMATTILLPGFDAAKVHEALCAHYAGCAMVSVAPIGGDESVIYASTKAGQDTLRIIVCGHETQTTVTALFDNLGKGASGAAVQNMNIVLGFDETTGLSVE